MKEKRDIVPAEYAAYSALYTCTILCNKYVLTSLGFQYPTIFQAWQTIVGLILMHMVSGFQIKDVNVRDVLPWVPAMCLYVGTIYSGSKALSQLPIPVFILGQGIGDVIVLMCNEIMPSVIMHISFPLRLAGGVIAAWSILEKSWGVALAWLSVHAVCSGTYRSISLWYSTSYWPYSNLSTSQRQYLNYTFSIAVLLPSIFLLGHHVQAKSFQHFGANTFYIGCVFSGICGWAVNKMWSRIHYKGLSDLKTHSAQLIAKLLTLILSTKIYPHEPSWSLWIGILLTFIADILQIIDSGYEKDVPQPNEEMHDILISM